MASMAALTGCMGGGGNNPSGGETGTPTSEDTGTPTESETTEAETTEAETTEAQTTESQSTTSGGAAAGDAIEPGTTLEFDGYTAAWEATAPESIAGESNPTLVLQEGEEYTFAWSNEDNQPHNVIIENSSGDNQFVSTEIISSGTQEVTFTAESAMATYYCEVHPGSMLGDVQVVSQ